MRRELLHLVVVFCRELLQPAVAAREGGAVLPEGAQAQPDLLIRVDAHGARVRRDQEHVRRHPGVQAGCGYVQTGCGHEQGYRGYLSSLLVGVFRQAVGAFRQAVGRYREAVDSYMQAVGTYRQAVGTEAMGTSGHVLSSYRLAVASRGYLFSLLVGVQRQPIGGTPRQPIVTVTCRHAVGTPRGLQWYRQDQRPWQRF